MFTQKSYSFYFQAKSRTKEHSYGLFWKQNRKRCCAFFGFDCQLMCERHFRWMKKSIRKLELYRLELLQSRRASRAFTALSKKNVEDEFGIYQNLDNTENINHVSDLLGPLPEVPSNESSDWSRRVSGMSEIYEEIREDGNCNHRKSKVTRVSIASGIYEEMKLNPKNISQDDSPPPLPPRSRLYTIETSISSITETELQKKKHWGLFDSMFTRKRADSCSSNPPSISEVQMRDKSLNDFQIKKSKRNSFSTPDLSDINIYGNTPSDTSETVSFDMEKDNIIAKSNGSSISNSLDNLFKENNSPLSPPAIENLDGYCPMGPGKGFLREKVQEMDIKTAKQPKCRNSIDDKIASYYPNDEYFKSPKKKSLNPPKRLSKSPKCNENIYISSPTAKTQPKKPQIVTKSTQNLYVVNRNILNESYHNSMQDMTITSDFIMDTSDLNKNPKILEEKFATLTRASRISSEKNSTKKNGNEQITRRFASLPRFRKIDLSPLRIRITNVLQRNNSENLP